MWARRQSVAICCARPRRTAVETAILTKGANAGAAHVASPCATRPGGNPVPTRAMIHRNEKYLCQLKTTRTDGSGVLNEQDLVSASMRDPLAACTPRFEPLLNSLVMGLCVEDRVPCPW